MGEGGFVDVDRSHRDDTVGGWGEGGGVWGGFGVEIHVLKVSEERGERDDKEDEKNGKRMGKGEKEMLCVMRREGWWYVERVTCISDKRRCIDRVC